MLSGLKVSAIGIDLGTTNTCVAVWRNERVDVIANTFGNRTPSCVAFNDLKRFIGEPALIQRTRNPRNTVYDVKRLMGRRFNDTEVQEDMKRWPFTVVDVGGKPRIQVEYKKETKTFAPEQISAMILRKMKEVADKYLDCDVKDAVITVPAYFNNAQRQATIDAGKIAGLNVLRIINEPTAAALAYGLDSKSESTRNVLIYDLGGGTLDVSIVSIEKGPMIEVLSTAGDTHLGGGDFDALVVKYLADEFNKKEGKFIFGNFKARSKLNKASEKSKILLSSLLQTDVILEALVDGIDFYPILTRAKFEELCSYLIRSTQKHVQKALDDAKLKKDDIDDVVLDGGSTRIPMVKQLLQEFFSGKSLKETINPDEAVAYGAAIQAAILTGDAGMEFKDLVYKDVTSLSLGVNSQDDSLTVVIPRHTSIPTEVTVKRVTAFDNQTEMRFMIYEGEIRLAVDNHFLGEFVLENVPKAPAREGKASLTFNPNENCVLNITAVEDVTGESNSIAINMKERGLSGAVLTNAVKELEMYQQEDRRKWRKC